MAIYDWWKSTFGKKERRTKIDAVSDAQAIIDYLKELHTDVSFLVPELTKLKELEKERRVGTQDLSKINLGAQIQAIDKILERYEFFQTDIDINGLRIKKIASQLMHDAKKADMDDLVKSKQKDPKWKFLW